MTLGYLYYAHNNEEINYLKLAICSALTGHFYIPEFRATVVTDKWSLDSLSKKETKLLSKCFEIIKMDNEFIKLRNQKLILNGLENKGIHKWWNKTRSHAYKDSEYNETILVDVDYIFQDQRTTLLWGSKCPVRINKEVLPLVRQQDEDKFLGPRDKNIGDFTLPVYWATLTYFNRSKFSQDFFSLVDHIRRNYSYYYHLHRMNDNAYRNDFAFSIALHMACGFKTPGPEFHLPFKYILVTQSDKLHKITKNSARFLVNTRDWRSPWHYLTLKNISYHCMNKVTLVAQFDNFVKFYGNIL